MELSNFKNADMQIDFEESVNREEHKLRFPDLIAAWEQASDLAIRLTEKEQRLAQVNAELEAERAHSRWLQSEWDNLKPKFEESRNLAHHWWLMAEQHSSELKKVYTSNSWRVTQPLRMISYFLKQKLFVKGSFRLHPKLISMMRIILASLIKFVLNKRSLSVFVLKILSAHPVLKARIRGFAANRGLIGEGMSKASDGTFISGLGGFQVLCQSGTEGLSLRAQVIFCDLKKAINSKDQEYGQCE